MNKSKVIKDMDQNLLKTQYLCMRCRVATPESNKFRSKLGFNQYDIELT